jgi:hypothetical protein
MGILALVLLVGEVGGVRRSDQDLIRIGSDQDRIDQNRTSALTETRFGFTSRLFLPAL